MTSRARAVARAAVAGLKAHGLGPSTPLGSRARWTTADARDWKDRTGWLIGCNFTPSTAGNQLELWQADTFDIETIDRELGWAAEVFGMNSIRLFLHDLAWLVDPSGFLDRLDQVLDVAAGHGISVMPVLFDGIWDPDPRPGPQRSPRPGIHNSTWLQSPGATIIADRSRWNGLRGYVEGVLERFMDDERVAVWDLWNEPDSPNFAYATRDPARKGALIGELLEMVWDWAAEVDPVAPLTVGVYLFPGRHAERASHVARTAIERSDVVSFHSYEAESGLTAAIDALETHGRPLICTEWMARPRSPVELVGVLAEREVGAYNWGLVDGRSQTRFSWKSWVRRDSADAPWFHDLLHPDGRAYDEREVEAFRAVSPRVQEG